MNRFYRITTNAVCLIFLGVSVPAAAQQKSDVEEVTAATRLFIKAISARDIRAMEKVWAHKPYVTFMGPLSTSIDVGWDNVRRSWEMRFSQLIE
jgi:hypothetical protein